jgi:hypothetical protein
LGSAPSDDAGGPERLAALLRSRYGLAVERLAAAPRGWTGETYAATADDGGRYFVKLYPKSRLPPTAAGALPVLADLHRAGLSQVSRPITTRDGALHEWLGDDLVVVFAYLEATNVPFTFGGEPFGDLIARIHRQTGSVTSPVARETFDRPYADGMWRCIDRARTEPATDELRQGLRRFLDEHADPIAEGWRGFDEIARGCRAAGLESVVTHGDWPFNLLQTADGTTHLVDWDELLLAPAERDTWFAGVDPGFWRGYLAGRPDHARSELATAFYVHNRYFEELAAITRDVLDDDVPARRAASLALLDNGWMAGLRARMAQSVRPAS